LGVNQTVANQDASLAKASEFLPLPIPSHKWDGNELFYHCRWLQPTDKRYEQKCGFSQIKPFNHLKLKAGNKIYSITII